MHFGLLVAVLQVSQAPAPFPVAKIEITPPAPTIHVGQTVQLSGRALDASGQPVANAKLQYFAGGPGAAVDSLGLVTGGYQGDVRVAVIANIPGVTGSKLEWALVHVLPAAPTSLVVTPTPTRLVADSRLTLVAAAYSAQGDKRDDAVAFTSSNPRVLSVTADGRVRALAAGQATLTATIGALVQRMPVQVLANTVARVTLEPGTDAVRTGDVVHFSATASDAAGKAIPNVGVDWSVAGGSGISQIDDQGVFVAELPGVYTVTATVGGKSADALVRATARGITRGIEVRAHIPIKFLSAEVWVHPGGKCLYLTTIADRVYAFDISDPAKPVIVDSMMTNARIVNDIMTTEDGKYGVFSREGASDRKNGIVVFEASDPCHPKPIAEYTTTVTGGVHSSYVYHGHAYITDDATGSLRIIDIRDPYHPQEVGRWSAPQTEAGRYLHDLMVVDGIGYLAYWNDGLIILDLGNGMKGGTPEHPQLISQFKYDLDATYSRVGQLWGTGFVRGTHTAWRDRNYVYVGDEVYQAPGGYKGLVDGNSLTFGRMHVIDVSDIYHPKEVAWYEPTDGGVHNVWVAGDTLYLGNYQGGARAVDISGELRGDLLRQGREMSWILTADSTGHQPHTPFAWGAVVRDGNIYVPDINSGLWVLRLEPKQTPLP